MKDCYIRVCYSREQSGLKLHAVHMFGLSYLGLCRDDGKANGSYYNRVIPCYSSFHFLFHNSYIYTHIFIYVCIYKRYIGIMDKNMEAIIISYLLGLFRYNGEENGSYCYMIHKGCTPIFSEGTRPCDSRYTEQNS